jgi:hypothetical protein
VAPEKFVPVIVTVVPPDEEPEVGLSEETVGSGTTYVYLSAVFVALVPAGVVTVTSTVPLPAGAVAVMLVGPLTVKDVAAVVPKLTAVAPVKLVPVIVTLVPPRVDPDVGFSAVTVGGGGGAVV